MIEKKDYLSFSRLSGFNKDGFRYFSRERKDSIALNIGTIVDEMLTSNNEIEGKFAVITTPKPTAMLWTLTEAVKDDKNIVFKGDDNIVHLNIAAIKEKVKELKLWNSIKDESKLEAKWNTKQFKDYLKEYLLADGKTIISFEDMELAKSLVKNLLSDKETMKYFVPDPGIELKFQETIMWEYDGQKYKSILDVIKLDHNAKEIEVADLKTGEEYVEKFKKSWDMFRYDIQYSMYMEAIISWARDNYPDYNIMPMVYIYVSKKEPERPVVFDINTAWMDVGKFGDDNKPWRKGWVQLTKEINWHYDNNVYNKPKYLAEQGRMFLDYYE